MKNPSRNVFTLVLTLVCVGFCFSNKSFGQLSLTNANNTQTIVFSTTISGVINGSYTGAGFQPSPTAGQLDSDAWASTGMSDGDLAFGGTATTGDYARGATTSTVTTAGFYAYTGAPGSVANPSFMFQPTADDFTPGTLTLRIQNNGTTAINQFQISYEILVRNDQGRANSLNFEYSIDGVNFIPVTALNYTTPEAAVTGRLLFQRQRLQRLLRLLAMIE